MAAIASCSGDLAYAHSRDSAAVSNWLTPQRGGCIEGGDGARQRNLSALVVTLTRWDHEHLIA